MKFVHSSFLPSLCLPSSFLLSLSFCLSVSLFPESPCLCGLCTLMSLWTLVFLFVFVFVFSLSFCFLWSFFYFGINILLFWPFFFFLFQMEFLFFSLSLCCSSCCIPFFVSFPDLSSVIVSCSFSAVCVCVFVFSPLSLLSECSWKQTCHFVTGKVFSEWKTFQMLQQTFPTQSILMMKWRLTWPTKLVSMLFWCQFAEDFCVLWSSKKAQLLIGKPIISVLECSWISHGWC